MAATAPGSSPPSPEVGISRLLTQQQQDDDDGGGGGGCQPRRRRSRSYTLPAGPSWLTSSSKPLAEARPGRGGGGRREVRKLQKEHPTGSSRPSMSLEIEGGGGGDGRGPSSSGMGLGVGVRKKMGRLRELYRK